MSEQVARALGAPGPTPVMIGGKECLPRPLSVEELTLIERDCLERYKRQYLQTFAQNADLLPEGRGQILLEEKMETAAKWDIKDLPPRFVFDPRRIVLNTSLKQYMTKLYGDVINNSDDIHMQRYIAAVLDQELLSPEQYKDMTQQDPPKTRVGYVNWWITGCYDGMITFVWVCFKRDGVTRQQCIEAMKDNPTLLVDLTRDIEKLSSPSVGNG